MDSGTGRCDITEIVLKTTLTLSKTSPDLYCGEKEKLLPILRTFCYFYRICNFRLQILSFRKSLKFVAWESVK